MKRIWLIECLKKGKRGAEWEDLGAMCVYESRESALEGLSEWRRDSPEWSFRIVSYVREAKP